MLRSAAALFASRPVRAQLELQAGLPALTGPEADIILPRLAYVFRNGDLPKIPWQSRQPSKSTVPLEGCSASAALLQVAGIVTGWCELNLQGHGRGCG